MSKPRRQIDWSSIRRDLAARLQRNAATFQDDPARVEALLRERARQLAARPPDPLARSRLQRVLLFCAAGERYAVAAAAAQEIIALPRIARTPQPDTGLLGLAAWRGEFVFVFGGGRVLCPREEGTASPRYAIVLRGPQPPIALAVDMVERVSTLDPALLQSPERLRSGDAQLFRGATADAVFVLNETMLLTQLAERLRAA